MGGSHVVNIELSVFPPASLLSTQAELFRAAVDGEVLAALPLPLLSPQKNLSGP